MAESARRRRLRAPSFGVGEVIGDTFSIWFRNLIPFFVLTVIIHAPLIIYAVTILYGDPTPSEVKTHRTISTWGGYILDLMVTGAVSYGVFRQLSGKPAGLAHNVVMGLRRLLPVLGVAICLVLLVMGCFIPTLFVAVIGLPAGYVLLFISIVLACVVGCMLFVSVPAAVVEGSGVIASLKRSTALTHGAKLGIFGVVVVIFLFILLLMIFIVPLLLRPGGDMHIWILTALQLALGLLMPVAQAAAYYRLRVAKEGIGIDELVKVFA